MGDLQSSIAEVRSTIEAALKRHSEEGVLPNILNALQAIEVTAMASTNGVKKKLTSFDQRIVELSANISALKEELVTREKEPDKATTAVEISHGNSNISTLRDEVSAHGVKLDKAVAIIETQQEAMKALLVLMQKGSAEAKEHMARLHSHFNGVADRIAFVDYQSSQNATSTTPRPIAHESTHSPHNRALPDHPMDVDASVSESHSTSDPPAPVILPYSNATPAILHDDLNNVLGIQLNTPTADVTATITDSPLADNVGINTTIVGESQTDGINRVEGTVVHQSQSPDTIEQAMTVTASRIPPDVITDTTAVNGNGSQNTAHAESAKAAAERDRSNVEDNVTAVVEKSRSAEMNGITVTAPHNSPSAGCVAEVLTITAKGTSPDMHADKPEVIENASQTTPDILGTSG